MSTSTAQRSRFAPVRFFSTRPSAADLVAGISVALVLMPQSLAYAEIAGLPPRVGIITATLPLLVAAPFVSCHYLQTGPVAVTSLLVSGGLASVADQGTAEYIEAASLLAIVVGCTRLILGLLGAGGITKLLRAPVVLGFTTGAAILIISSQFNRTIGSATPDDYGVLRRALWALTHPGTWSPAAIGISLLTAALVLGGRRVHKLFPSVLLAVIVAVVMSNLGGYGQEMVGEIPNDLPSFSVDLPWGRLGDVLLPGLVIAFIGFAEPASIALQFSSEDDLEWDPSQELRGGGLGNLTSAFIGGYPVGGSFSRSSLNRFAGAESSWSGFITGVCVLACLPLVPLLKNLPRAALSAIIVVAIVRLVKVVDIWGLLRARKNSDGVVALVTMVATIASAPNLQYGVLAGVAVGGVALLIDRRAGGNTNGLDDADRVRSERS